MSKILEEIRELRQRPSRYWHHYYARLRRNNGASAKQILFGQIIGVSLSLVAGYFLEDAKATLILIPGTLLLLPGLVDVVASMAAALSAKINHHLEETSYKNISIVLHDVSSTWRQLVVSSFFVGTFAAIVGIIFFKVEPLKLIFLCVVVSSVVGILLFPIIAGGVLLVRKMKLDPDNIVGPIETSVVDVVLILVLILTIRIIA